MGTYRNRNDVIGFRLSWLSRIAMTVARCYNRVRSKKD